MGVHLSLWIFHFFKVVALIAHNFFILAPESAFSELFLLFDLRFDIEAVFIIKPAHFIDTVFVKEHALFVIKSTLVQQEEPILIIISLEFFDFLLRQLTAPLTTFHVIAFLVVSSSENIQAFFVKMIPIVVVKSARLKYVETIPVVLSIELFDQVST